MNRKFVLDLDSCRPVPSRRAKPNSSKLANISSHSTETSPASSFITHHEIKRDPKPSLGSLLTRTRTSKAVEINRARQLSPRVNLVNSNRRLRSQITEATEIALEVVKRVTERRGLLRTESIGHHASAYMDRSADSFKVEASMHVLPQHMPDDSPESPKFYEAPKKRDIQQFIRKSEKYGSKFVGILSSSPCKNSQPKQTDFKKTGFKAQFLDDAALSPIKTEEANTFTEAGVKKERRIGKRPAVNKRSMLTLY